MQEGKLYIYIINLFNLFFYVLTAIKEQTIDMNVLFFELGWWGRTTNSRWVPLQIIQPNYQTGTRKVQEFNLLVSKWLLIEKLRKFSHSPLTC